MNNDQKKFWKTILATASVVAAMLAVMWSCSGCMNENTGVSAAVGDITTLPEISDSADNISVKILYMMTGARVWTAKDSNVKVKYRTVHTNDYCGIFHTRGVQDLEVTVEPVESSSAPSTISDGDATDVAESPDATK